MAEVIGNLKFTGFWRAKGWTALESTAQGQLFGSCSKSVLWLLRSAFWGPRHGAEILRHGAQILRHGAQILRHGAQILRDGCEILFGTSKPIQIMVLKFCKNRGSQILHRGAQILQ